MAEDWFVVSIEAIQRAAVAAEEALQESRAKLEPALRDRRSGDGVVQLVDSLIESGGPVVRRNTGAALEAYSHAVMQFRGALVRALVDDAGWSLTDVARRMSISRQMATRLYRAAKPA